ncbi:MAG TPA: hypothetical protein VIH93_01485 [Thermoanaerobaculia bacterium]|jgi:hypothetical protein
MRTLRLPAALLAGVAGLAGLLLAGCFDIEESIDLDRNLSGKAGLDVTVDMGAMVVPMLMMSRGMEGKTGDPTPAEIAKARQEMIDQQKKDPSKGPSAPKREDIEKSLPPGVRLIDAGVDDAKDLKMKAHFRFAFDDLNKLAQIREAKKDEAAPGPGKPTLFDQPFAALKLVDEGKTLLLSTQLGNPVSEAGSQVGGGGDAPPTPEAQKTIDQIFQGLHLRFRLTTPFTVVDSNATRRDGQTLVWDLDSAAVQKLAASKQPLKIWARLRR